MPEPTWASFEPIPPCTEKPSKPARFTDEQRFWVASTWSVPALLLLETLVFWRIAASIDVDEHWLPLRPFMLTAAISAALAAVLLWRTRGTWRALAWAMAATSGVWTAGVVFYLLVLGGVGITW